MQIMLFFLSGQVILFFSLKGRSFVTLLLVCAQIVMCNDDLGGLGTSSDLEFRRLYKWCTKVGCWYASLQARVILFIELRVDSGDCITEGASVAVFTLNLLEAHGRFKPEAECRLRWWHLPPSHRLLEVDVRTFFSVPGLVTIFSAARLCRR